MNRENAKVWKTWEVFKIQRWKILKYWSIIYESVKVWKYKAVECWEI